MVSIVRKETVEFRISLTEPPRKSKYFKNPEVRCYYKSVFDEWDADKDGFISIDELKSLISSNENIQISDQCLQYLYSRFDRDHNNQLDFEEFFEMINHPKFKFLFRRVTSRYLKFLDIPKYRQTVKLKRQTSNTGTYEDEFDFSWKKICIIIISIIQILLYYINSCLRQNINDEGPIVSALKFRPENHKVIYTYFTSALVHNPNKTSHLYGNVILQIIAGIPLELVHGWRVILLYAIGALGGSLTHYVLAHDHSLRGASPCVYSFFTAHIVTVLLNWKEMVHPTFHIIVFGIFVLFDVGYEPILHYMGYEATTTSHPSHLGGALVGLFLSAILLKNVYVTRREKIFTYVGGVMFMFYISTLIIMNCTETYWTIIKN